MSTLLQQLIYVLIGTVIGTVLAVGLGLIVMWLWRLFKE